MRTTRAILAIAVGASLALPLGTSVATAQTGEPSATPVVKAGSINAQSALAKLPGKSETGSGYARSKFRHWTTKGGCDTRARVLKQESSKRVTTSGRCTVRSGAWLSRYDGLTYTSASGLDVDHVVPLAEAWRSGAKKWNTATRTAYANDMGYKGSLMAVSASSNRSKGDRDPQAWMPTQSSYRCTYAKTWIAVKYRWRLAIDSGERAAIASVLQSDCSNLAMKLPKRASVKTGGSTGGGSTKPSGSGSAYYKNCDAARAAGAAPVYAGDPGYGRHLDRDGDGVGCE